MSKASAYTQVSAARLQGSFVMLALAVALPFGAARELMQASYTDADIFNFALNLEYLQVRASSISARAAQLIRPWTE